jgi:hypothetical protein
MRRVTRYLALVGSFPRWWPVVGLAIAAYGIAGRLSGGDEPDAAAFLLTLLPIAAGTGLLSAARAGRLDLLFGSGVSRAAVWKTAVIRSVAIPAGIIAVLTAIFIPSTPDAAFRAVAIALFTGGICFAAGLRQPAYILGAAWVIARIAFLLSKSGFAVYHQVRHAAPGIPLPSIWRIVMAGVAFPEFLLEKTMPLGYPIAAALCGLIALAISYALFQRADFAGKRTE